MFRHFVRNISIASLLFIASGCLLTTSNSVDECGVEVPNSTLRQVEIGKTTDQWLIAAIGQPTSRVGVRGPGEVEILGYKHETVKKSRGSLFLLFAGSSREVDRATTYFEISDGVVSKYWTES